MSFAYSEKLIAEITAYYRKRCSIELSPEEAVIRLRSMGRVFLAVARIREGRTGTDEKGGAGRAKRDGSEPSYPCHLNT